MNRVNIYRAPTNDQTTISNVFIDKYMADANDAQLKIYLFLIRMMNANLPTSVTDIADKFNYTEKDVLRSLMYWESRQLLALDFDAAHNLSGIRVLALEKVYEAPNAAPRITPVLSFIRPTSMQTGMTARAGAAPLVADHTTADSGSQPANGTWDNKISKPQYSPDDIQRFQNNEDIEQLLMVAEQYVAKPLNHTEMDTIFFLYDKLGFSVDLIDYLIQDCVERGKRDFRYIESVALSWHEQGITSPTEAQNASRKYNKTVYTIMKSLGKSTAPALKELEYIKRWTKEYDFELDVIQAACDKTVMLADRNRFAYADAILTQWHKAGVHHKTDIPAADADYKYVVSQNTDKPHKINNRTNNIVTRNKFNDFAQNTYDFDALEQSILSN